jgi:hypothetical protein
MKGVMLSESVGDLKIVEALCTRARLCPNEMRGHGTAFTHSSLRGDK